MLRYFNFEDPRVDRNPFKFAVVTLRRVRVSREERPGIPGTELFSFTSNLRDFKFDKVAVKHMFKYKSFLLYALGPIESDCNWETWEKANGQFVQPISIETRFLVSRARVSPFLILVKLSTLIDFTFLRYFWTELKRGAQGRQVDLSSANSKVSSETECQGKEMFNPLLSLLKNLSTDSVWFSSLDWAVGGEEADVSIVGVCVNHTGFWKGLKLLFSFRFILLRG